MSSRAEMAGTRTRKKLVPKKEPEFKTIDCETDPFHNCQDVTCPKCHGQGRVPQPFIWGTYDGKAESYDEFESMDELVHSFFARQPKGTLFYAHNGGKFDYHYLRDYINSDEPVLLINGRLARFRIGECEFRDSLNIFPNTRLKDFDDSTGKKLDIDYAKMEPGARTDPNTKAEISSYLKMDCVRLWGVVDRYWREYGKRLTQAGASMKFWESMAQMTAPRQTKSQFDRYRRFYYGGRVQAFEMGYCKGKRFRVADINSAYPRAMLEEHPMSPAGNRESVLPRQLDRVRTSMIELDCTARGCFPWRDLRTGETYFPEDDLTHGKTRRYWVTGHEFLTALELDAVTNITIRSVHVFSQTVNFRFYIEHFYELREEARRRGDVAGRTFGKYFMNGLYGKFGANCEKYSEYLIATDETLDYWQGKGYQLDQPWGQRFLLSRPPRESDLNDLTNTKWRYYNVCTAASITGYVRAQLFRAITASSGVLYCDTDSVAARGTDALEFGAELGRWKDEGEFDAYAIAGKKLYAFHHLERAWSYDPQANEKEKTWKIACKGVNFAALENGPDIIRRIASGEEVKYFPEVPTYSVTRDQPRFIPRTIVSTFKDIRQAPAQDLKFVKSLDPVIVRF